MISRISSCSHQMLSPKNVKTLFLKRRAKSKISDSRIFFVVLSSCHNNLPFWVNRLATSTVMLAKTLVAVNASRTRKEYWGWETSRFKKISASRMSKLLQKWKCSSTSLTSGRIKVEEPYKKCYLRWTKLIIELAYYSREQVRGKFTMEMWNQ